MTQQAKDVVEQMIPTPRLRYRWGAQVVETRPDGSQTIERFKVLQQRWEHPGDPEVAVWVDVPLVEGDA